MKNYPEISKALGEAIDSHRKERGMTKTSLAIRADLEDRYVRAIIKGEKNPTIYVLTAICEALNISLSALMSHVEDRLDKSPKSCPPL